MHMETEHLLDINSLRKAMTRFTRQGDRGTALVAAAWLDDAMEARIRAACRPNKATVDEMLRPDGPLGSFSARIKLAFLFDLIEPMVKKDLDLIRRIRNEFAHKRHNLTFVSNVIRNRCDELHGAKAFRLGVVPLRSPKQKFLFTVYFLAAYLLLKTGHRKRGSETNEIDAYGTWVRRTAKSYSIALSLAGIEGV